MSEEEEKELCGAETVDGGSCQRPLNDEGECDIPSHNDPEAENPHGRPTKFSDKRARAAIKAARNSKSRNGCARAAAVSLHTLNNWLDMGLEYTDKNGETKDFLQSFMRARAEGELLLVQGGLKSDDIDSSMAKFLLATSFGYKKTEKRELTGEDGGPLEIDSIIEVMREGRDKE